MADRRTVRRNTAIRILRRQNDLLATTLRDVWMWLATDGEDHEALRTILARADRNSSLVAELDRLEQNR